MTDEIKLMLKSELGHGSVHIKFLHREPRKKQSMKLFIWCQTNSGLQSALARAQALDECNARLHTLADGYGFEWMGYEACSRESLVSP